MRENPDEFVPFLAFEGDGAELSYANYCDKVGEKRDGRRARERERERGRGRDREIERER